MDIVLIVQKENGKTKIIETNLTKYGCISSMQNEIVKNKQKILFLKIWSRTYFTIRMY